MSADDFEQQQPVSGFGAQLRADWLAHHQANSDMASAASMAAHAAQRAPLVASKQGIFADATGEQLAATAAAQAATVGTGTDAGRPLERLGGTNWEAQGAGAVGPIPGGAYANLNRPADQLGESPLLRFMRSEH